MPGGSITGLLVTNFTALAGKHALLAKQNLETLPNSPGRIAVLSTIEVVAAVAPWAANFSKKFVPNTLYYGLKQDLLWGFTSTTFR